MCRFFVKCSFTYFYFDYDYARGGGIANDYTWLHGGGGVWKALKCDYIICEWPLIIAPMQCDVLAQVPTLADAGNSFNKVTIIF